MGRLGNFRFLALTGAVLFLAGSLTPARAQDPDDLKRGVARISLINGDVSVRRGDSGDWVAGVINAPLLTDDYVATGPNSRAEVQFDANNLLRLGANAELRLTQLEYGRNQMELARGVMTYRMLRSSDGNIEIDTPSLSVRPSRQGSFRVSVNEAGETEVSARNGDVEVFTPHGSQWVRNGQTLMARGASSDAEFQVVAAGGPDEWDRWSDSRDRAIIQSTSSRYVGPGVYGAEDLDAAGTWTSVPEYGNVWRPAVGPDWAPYQSGRWVWEDWYGWTWVSYDPWGWAPYHYGRWFHHDSFGWCWYPGLVTARHYWSPALVGFFGFGGGGGIGFGFGNVGWVPLAPFEVFHPWWGRGFYGRGDFNHSINITNVNITNVNVTNVYRNAQFRNGISAVAAHDFQNGRFNNVIRTSGAQVGSAGVIRGQMPFTATSAQHLRFSDRQATAIPRSSQNARFFTQQQPNPVPRGQLNLAGRQTTQPAASPNNRVGNGQNSDAGGWRRFGSPSGQPSGGQGNQPSVNRNGSASPAQAPRNDRPSASPQGGWQRFGAPAGGNTPSQPVNRNGSASPAQAPRNDQPSASPQGGWQRFGAPAGGNTPSQGQSPAAPRQNFRSSPDQGQRFGAPGGGAGRQDSLRIAPPVVRERPSYSAPRQSAPSYNSAPRQSAPAPRSNGGGSEPHGNSGSSHGGGRNR
jgi:hypothetical protein